MIRRSTFSTRVNRRSLVRGVAMATSSIIRRFQTRYRMATSQDKGIRTDIYQATMLHECFADPLNVVILVKTESGEWRPCTRRAFQQRSQTHT